MITPQLLTYITQRLGQGANKETIKNDLLAAGWQEPDINEAFGAVEKQVASPNQAPPSPTNDATDLSRFFQKPANSHGWKAIHYYEDTNAPKIIKLVMRYSGGMIKTETQATVILSVFIFVCFVTSITLSYQYYFKPGSRGPSGETCLNPPTCDK